MFKKIVSNLHFSPALVGQLGFYAKRLKKEEATRRIGLIFVALALVVQSFAVFSPPESANAASGNNVIYGGIRDKNDLIGMYDRNSDGAGHNDLQQIYTYFGISRQDIINGSVGTFNSRDQNLSILSVGRSTYAWQRDPHAIPGTSTTLYSSLTYKFDSQPYTIRNGSTYRALIGHRASDGGWFAIMMDCGNAAYITLPPPPPPPPTPTPVAICSGLTVTPLTRTNFRLSATAQVEGGAGVKGYRFEVKDTSGAVISTDRVNGDGLATFVDVNVKKDGNYSASVVVGTSIGDKTGANCQKAFTVSPEPRCKLNPELVESSPECKPCENDSTIWYKDKKCTSVFDVNKTVKNVTQLVDNANNTTAKTSDTLEYRLTVKNTGNKTDTYVIKDNMSDVFEYAELVDAGGGVVTTAALSVPVEKVGVVTWAPIAIKPGQTITKIVNVKVKAAIPPTPQSPSNPESYNCRMVNDFAGNNTIVMVDCPKEKAVEQVITQLPHTGPGENMLFAGAVLAIATYFYARTRQVKKEVRLIRRDLNSGTI